MQKQVYRHSSKKNILISGFEKLLQEKGLSLRGISLFRKIIYDFYRGSARRNLPWRHTKNSYPILVSEIMLQQTQVERVMKKYEQFIFIFPDFHSLARAPLSRILSVWQGLGYNRRAIALKKIAQRVVKDPFWGVLPSSVDSLMRLPGIGRATASSVAAFAFQQPVAFIETNIRRVFLHFFFREKESIRDNEILPLVEKTLDRKNPRRWYFALMDYGAMLKKLEHNPNRRSAHYQKQPPFQGSNRQVRGLILKTLIATPNISELKIARILSVKPERIKENLRQLQKEGFITKKAKGFVIRT